MKKLNNFYFMGLLLMFAVSFNSNAQSISGNMNSENMAVLGYGNVDIYKGEEKIASVLTDAAGNFNVKLDTGYYRVEFNYEGHDKLVKNIHVTGDEKSDFALETKDGYVAPKYEMAETESIDAKSSYSRGESLIRMHSSGSRKKSGASSSERITTSYDAADSRTRKVKSEARAGALTAGEINDFSKWEMWNDLADGQLSAYKNKWDLFFSERYTVQLKNENGFPVVDATVQLLDESKKVQYESRTDNTGKAELWGKLGLKDTWGGSASAVVHYKGETHTIRRLTTFQNGVNSLTLKADCENSDVVDIAFVVDATGSMSDEINFFKKELNHVIYKSKNDLPDLTFNFANVFYRDRGDEYVTRRHDFTNVLSSSIDFITKQKAAGGGSYEEAMEIALEEALDKLKWSDEARSRILFLVLDAPPRNTPQIRQKLKDIARKAASKGIRIVPLAASGIKKDTEYLMRCFALGTNGTYAFLTNHSGIGNPHIEPSTDKYEVEFLNELMIRIIDSYTYIPDCDEDTPIEEENKNPEVSDSLMTIDWNVWPNPTQGDLKIKISEDVDELFITDITGKIMNRFTEIKKNRELDTNISEYARGIYVVSFKRDEEVFARKVVLI